MKKSVLIVIVFVLGLGLLLTACGGGGGGGAPSSAGSNITANGAGGGSGGGSSRGGGGSAKSVTIKNTNDFEICQAFISLANQDAWGSNIFAPDEKVAPGASLNLTSIPSGNYDLKVVNCDGTQEGKLQFTMP